MTPNCNTADLDFDLQHNDQEIPTDSELTTSAPLLELRQQHDQHTTETQKNAHSVYETVGSPIPHYGLSDSKRLEKQLELPQGWPTLPQPVNVRISTLVWEILVDIILLALSASFLAFALCVISYNRKPTSLHQQAAERLAQASQWGPTIYPILFASVVGRATYAILLWRLEKGEKIGTLDILAGSTSLTSTVVSQFQLRLVSFVGIGLVAIWILSPVGGQSSFRQISFGPSNDPEDASFQYLVPGAYMWTPLDFGFSLIIDQTYVAALLNAVANGSPRDSWGHVKVPRIEHYEHTSSPSRDGWYNTTSGPRDSYSSLIGIPMNVTEPAESAHYINYTTTIDAMYFHLDCDMLPFQEDPVFENHGDCWLGYTYWNGSSIERAKLPPDELRPFAFGLDGGPDLGPILNYSLSCTVESAYVEVEVSCATHDTCAASRVRRSKLDPSPPPVAYTWLDLERDDMNTMWDTITWGTTPGLQNLSLAYLWNPENPIAPVLEVPSSEDASIRVEQMLNTYWAAMNNRMVSLGSIGNDTTWLDNNISWPFQDGSQNMDLFDDNNPKQVEARQKARTWLSKGKKLDNTEIFKAHWGWVVALLLSSTVLIAASLIPFYIRCFLSQSPGILMNFSSLAIRDNVYLAPPATGTYLGAADRLRYLKDVRIRFGDVDEGNGTGTLAIARLGEVAALKKGRKYA